MAQFIPANNQFIRNTSILNQQFMQMNRDRVNRATKQFQIARALGDQRGIADARNLLENKGMFSSFKHLPYNRRTSDVPKSVTGQVLQGVKANPELAQQREALKGKITEKTGGAMADVLGQAVGSARVGNNFQPSNMVEETSRGETGNRVVPYDPETRAEIQNIRDKGDRAVSQEIARQTNTAPKVDDNKPIDIISDDVIKRATGGKNAMSDLIGGGIEAGAENIPDKDIVALAQTEKAIKKDMDSRINRIQSASPQTKGIMQMDWKELQRLPLTKYKGGYSDMRTRIMNIGLDAISSMKNEWQRYTNIIKLQSKLKELDDHYGIRGRDYSKELFAMFKQPRRSGDNRKLKSLRAPIGQDANGNMQFINVEIPKNVRLNSRKGIKYLKKAYNKTTNKPFGEWSNALASKFSPAGKGSSLSGGSQTLQRQSAYDTAYNNLIKQTEGKSRAQKEELVSAFKSRWGRMADSISTSTKEAKIWKIPLPSDWGDKTIITNSGSPKNKVPLKNDSVATEKPDGLGKDKIMRKGGKPFTGSINGVIYRKGKKT